MTDFAYTWGAYYEDVEGWAVRHATGVVAYCSTSAFAERITALLNADADRVAPSSSEAGVTNANPSPWSLGYESGMAQGKEDALRALARVFRKVLTDDERAQLTRWLTGADHLEEFLAVLRATPTGLRAGDSNG